MELGLKGKTALVAGASGGIGRAVARALGEEKCNVAVHYCSSEETAQETARRVEAAGGRSCLLAADLSDATQAEGLVRSVVERFGSVDILVNCVGVVLRKPFHSTSDREWRRVLSINLDGPFYLCRAAAQVMRERRRGVMINLCSAAGTAASIGGAAYGASKAGVIVLTKTIAAELAPFGVRALACSPGLTATEMSASLSQQWGEEVTRTIPLARAAMPDEIASVVVFLASDRASYLTGVNVEVTGGKFAVQNPWIAWQHRDLPNPCR